MLGKQRSKREAAGGLSSNVGDEAERRDKIRKPARQIKLESKSTRILRATHPQASAPSDQQPRLGHVTSSPASRKSRSTPSKTKPIYSFFNAATQRQQSIFEPNSSPDPSQSLRSQEVDAIEDDECADIPHGQLSDPSRSTSLALAGRKRKFDVVKETTTDCLGLLRSTQRFKKTATRSNKIVLTSAEDYRPWTERFAPDHVSELAVHKKKVQAVRYWLEGVISGHERKRLLIIKGAAGSGKTTTINLLSREMDLHVNEWTNPSLQNSDDGFVSMAAQFEDFIRRSSKFGALQFTEAASGTAPGETYLDLSRASQKQIVLIEEFPSHSTRSSDALRAFRTALLHYLEASLALTDPRFSGPIARAQPVVPIIMIISESLLSSDNGSSDSFSAYRLLGPDILSHPAVTAMEFNAIAPTFMTKALDLILIKESRKSGRRRAPGPAALRCLAETGDIRSAVSSLQFLSLRGDNSPDWTGRIAFTSKQKRVVEVPLSKMETESLQLITQRESTLDIFHAVGKVLYNKREVPPASDAPAAQPPYHLPQHQRPRVPEANSDDLFNKLGTDVSTFIAALQENYVLSCQGLDREDTIDHVNECIDTLSDADMLFLDRYNRNQFRQTYGSAGTDSLRQEEISFQVSVLGLLFHLPHPVKRLPMPQQLIQGRDGKPPVVKASGFQMLYPSSQRLWRKQEETEQRIEVLARKLRDHASAVGASSRSTPSRHQKPVMSAVEAWRLNRFGRGSSSHSAGPADRVKPGSKGYGTSAAVVQEYPEERGKETEHPTRGAMTTVSSNDEMILERLPFMMLMHGCGRQTFPSELSAEIEQLARVRVQAGVTREDDEDEDADLQTSLWRTKMMNAGLDSLDTRLTSHPHFGGSPAVANATSRINSMVLDDDDIED